MVKKFVSFALFVVKKLFCCEKCLAKFVSFVERGRSLKFKERKIRFFRFIRC